MRARRQVPRLPVVVIQFKPRGKDGNGGLTSPTLTSRMSPSAPKSRCSTREVAHCVPALTASPVGLQKVNSGCATLRKLTKCAPISPLPCRPPSTRTSPCLIEHTRDSPRRRPQSRDVEKGAKSHFPRGKGTHATPSPPPHRLLHARLSQGSWKRTRDLPYEHDDVRAASSDLKIPARWTSSSANTTPTSPLRKIALTWRSRGVHKRRQQRQRGRRRTPHPNALTRRPPPHRRGECPPSPSPSTRGGVLFASRSAMALVADSVARVSDTARIVALLRRRQQRCNTGWARGRWEVQEEEGDGVDGGELGGDGERYVCDGGR